MKGNVRLITDTSKEIAHEVRARGVAGVVLISSISTEISRADRVYQDNASVKVSNGTLHIVANAPRPLDQALVAVGQYFGWIVDYEDPMYSTAETVDAAVSSWRIRHPQEKGVLVPSGARFAVEIEVANNDKLDEDTILRQIIDRYNGSANPGTFALKKTAVGRVVVTGQSGKQGGSRLEVLDGTFRADSNERNGMTALDDMLSKCRSLQGIPITIGIIPINALSHVSVPGEQRDTSCRERLSNILTQLRASPVYRLLYDPGSEGYVLNIVPPYRLVKNANGESQLQQIPLRK